MINNDDYPDSRPKEPCNDFCPRDERINQLLEANNREVEKRRLLESKIKAMRGALEAADAASWKTTRVEPEATAPDYSGGGAFSKPVHYRRDPCSCTTCITVRAVIAFLQVAP